MLRFTIIAIALVLFSIAFHRPVAAQQSGTCAGELEEASTQYAQGRFDETIALTDRCLEKENILESERRAAYRLKGLSYIGKGLEGDAKASVRRLLAIVPNYEPDPILDPPDFVALVNEVKAESGNRPRVTYSGEQGARVGPDRGGFTLLLSLGVGFQNDAALEESGTGLAGLNLGIGGFLSDNVALMARFSGTNVNYEFEFLGIEGDFRQISGVAALSLQYWVNDKVYVEGGPGLGFYSIDIDGDTFDDQSFGLILGTGFTVFNKGRNNLQIGLEFAPAFIEEGTISNIGITFGYQLL